MKHKFKVGDWVEWGEDNSRPLMDVSIPYQVLDLEEDGRYIFLNVIGDDRPNISWPSSSWRPSKHQQFKDILKELYEDKMEGV